MQTTPDHTQARTPASKVDHQDATARVRAAAVALLDQIAASVAALDAGVYARPENSGGGATIGKHVRHALDHYAALLERDPGPGGTVAYDRRVRGGSVETDPDAAAARALELRARIDDLGDGGMGAEVRIGVLMSPDDPEVELRSTLVRELAFVCHHATHHLAMIKPLARESGIELPAELGRAPSTVAHERDA